MKIECLSEDLKEVLCKARVQNSDNGKFVRFLVDGAKLPKVIFRIKRGNNHNTNISGIFTAPLDVDPGTAIPLVHDEVLNQLKSQFAWLRSDRQRQFYLKREVLADMALYKHIFRDNDPIYQHFGTAYMAAVARNWSLHLTALEKGIHATLGLSDLTFDSEKNIFYGSLQRLLVILKQQDIPQAFKAGINKTFFELAIAKYKKDGFVNNHALLADKWFYATPEMVICLNREMDRIDSAANRKITKNAIFDYFLAMSYYKTGQTDNFLKNADIFITTYPDFSEVEDLKNKMLQAKSRTP